MASPTRIAVAAAVIIGGAVLAAQMPEDGQQIVFMVIAGIAALFITLLDPPPAPLPDPAVQERQRKQLLYQGRSEAYQDVINPITDPILLVRNAKVAAANPAAAASLRAGHGFRRHHSVQCRKGRLWRWRYRLSRR